jgi:hypothetical protein
MPGLSQEHRRHIRRYFHGISIPYPAHFWISESLTINIYALNTILLQELFANTKKIPATTIAVTGILVGV